MANGCSNGGQEASSLCNSQSSTFFIILGFTMLILVLLLFFIVVVACIKRQKLRARAQMLQNAHPGSQRAEDDCVIYVNGAGQIGGPFNGVNMENVKCVIMAGEEKPTFIAHPAARVFPATNRAPVAEEMIEIPLHSQENSAKEADMEGDDRDLARTQPSNGERDAESGRETQNPPAAQHGVT